MSGLGEAVIQGAAQLEVLLKNLHVGVVVHDASGQIVLCNDRALTLLGLTEDQLLGRTSVDPMWEVTHEDGAPFPGSAHPSMVALATRQPVRDVVMGVTRPVQRDQVWLLVSAQPYLRADGALSQVIVTFTDITDRKRLEDTLRRTERMESIGALASGIAHDFNNLLTIILVSVDAARDAPDPATLRQELSHIADASTRAASLTQQLLAFARQRVRAPVMVSPDTIIQHMAPLLRRTLGGRVRLRLSLGSLGWCVWLDPSQLEQIVLNLSANACDAMPRGGDLEIATAPAPLDAAAAAPLGLPPGDYVELRFQDGGDGIAPDVIGHIFEPFFTTKRAGRGTGLGLSTVHGIVKQAGGHVAASSVLGQGTTFRLLLPRVRGSSDQPPPPHLMTPI